MTAFRLPLAPSANALVRPNVMYLGNDRRVAAQVRSLIKAGLLVARQVATGEAKDYRRAAHARLPIRPIPGPVELYVTVSVPSISSDLSNRTKALEDALTGRLYFDDKQTVELHETKVIGEPGCIVEVVQADPREHEEIARRLSKSSIQEKANERAQRRLFEPTPNFTPGEK